jgi:hypothetical protein
MRSRGWIVLAAVVVAPGMASAEARNDVEATMIAWSERDGASAYPGWPRGV